MKTSAPPQFLLRLLKAFCKPEYHADIEGDFNYPKKVKKLLASGANLRPDTTAIDPALLPILDKMWPRVKNDSVRSKQFKLLVEQPNIKAADLKKIKADVMIMGGRP